MALDADASGFITQTTGNSLLVAQETGETKLLITTLADFTYNATDSLLRSGRQAANKSNWRNTA